MQIGSKAIYGDIKIIKIKINSLFYKYKTIYYKHFLFYVKPLISIMNIVQHKV